MTKTEIIASLLDQARDKDALANGEADSIFADDARALREAAELLKSVPGWVSVDKALPAEGMHVIGFDIEQVGLSIAVFSSRYKGVFGRNVRQQARENHALDAVPGIAEGG